MIAPTAPVQDLPASERVNGLLRRLLPALVLATTVPATALAGVRPAYGGGAADDPRVQSLLEEAEDLVLVRAEVDEHDAAHHRRRDPNPRWV